MDESSGAADDSTAGAPESRPDAADRAVEALLGMLSRKHALALLSRFAEDPGPWRYNELQDELDVSPTSLSSRLSAFEEAGLVTRTTYDENSPCVEYTATDDAEALRPVFRALYEWVDHRE